MESGFKFYIDEALKYIVISPTATELDIKIDIYSDLKEWFTLYTNAKYPFPIRTIGGDDIGGGQTAGDMYFLINGYRVVYDPTKVKVNGILFSDNFDTPWLNVGTLQPVYPATVSSLALSVAPDLSGLDLSEIAVPTASENASAVRSELSAELAEISATNTNVTTVKKILKNRTETNPVTGVMTVYDDDGISVLFTANIWENIAATDPYAGNAVNRRDALA